MSVNQTKLAMLNIIIQRDGSPDDVLRITPSQIDDGYNMTLVQNTIGLTTTKRMANWELVPYLTLFFAVINMDTDRPDYIQIDSPSLPSVLISPSQDIMPILTPIISLIQDDWPEESTHAIDQLPVKWQQLSAAHANESSVYGNINM